MENNNIMADRQFTVVMYDVKETAQILESALDNVAMFHAMGGLLAAGTDAGAWAVPHGSTTEEGYFAAAGVGEDALTRGADAIMAKF